MSRVVIKECADYNMDKLTLAINGGVKLAGGWERFIKPGYKVLLKVNLIGPKTSDTAAVTHSEFVRAITRILKGRGCTVWIGDSSGGAIAGMAPTARGLILSGLDKVAKEEGAQIKNFDREGVVFAKATDTGKEMYLAKPLFDADFVINLPKLKTHSSAIYTGTVKNVFGCIPGLKKAEYHRSAPDPRDFGHVIADINKSLKIGLHIMDGIYAMQGEGPTAGEPYHAGKILISPDPLALDTVASAMLGMEIEDIPILLTARERGLGESHIKNIDICGDYNSPPVLKNFKYPKNFRRAGKRNYKSLVKVIDFLRARPNIDLKYCKGCNMCVESCPVKAIDRKTKKIDYSRCIDCLCCHELCEHKAVRLKRDNAIANAMTKLYRGKYR